MEIKVLKDTSEEKILEVFNLSFSDYFVPFHLTIDQLKSKIKADKINLDLSVGVFENEKLIAFILHGIDIVNNKKMIYNGGTGVIPEKRGHGLTKQMYSFILPILKEQKVDSLILEVISKNIQAIKSYKKTGYKIQRELKCYKGQVNTISGSDNLNIKKMFDCDWILMQSFWDIAPTWQNSINAIDELKDSNISFGAFIDNALVGYLVYNPKGKRIQQIAVDKNFRKRKIATTLVSSIIEEYGNDLSIINVDKRSKSTNSFLSRIGLENFLDQVEMKLELTKA